MKKSYINLIIDILLLLFLAAIGGIGILMKYIMPSNYSVRWEGATSYARNVLGLDRHGWGYIHWILSLFFLFLVLLHIVLHWKMIENIANRMIPNRVVCNVVVAAILFLVVFFILGPFVLML